MIKWEAASPKDVNALLEIAKEFTAAFNSGDVNRLMRFYGSSYVDVNLRIPLQSHQQRREYYTQVMHTGLRVQVHPEEIVVHNNIALVRGRIELAGATMGASGRSATQLRYLEIFRRDADNWKAVWGIDGPIHE